MTYAPIIIFAFNRLKPLQACVAALQTNSEAKESDLIVFVDGARPQKQGEKEKVQDVCDFVKTITGFKSHTYHFSRRNKGLGPSIIAGVTEVVNLYGKAIILEDDLIVSQNFLSYMNQGLEKYESNKKVFSIGGWGCKVQPPKNYYYDAYMDVRSTSWGWGTWIDRWKSVDWELKNWGNVVKTKRSFNRWGGGDCYSMLKGWHDGHNQSWAIRFTYAQFLQNKLTLFPILSKVDNKGFDENATDCPRYCRTKWIFEDSSTKEFRLPDDVRIDNRFHKQVMYYRSFFCRAKAKLINLFLNILYKFS